ncbi:hypothetical protein SAMN05216379_102125 [Nitrosomonas eutropha]|uniref:hypothetical protein n=1 Tax=Nitrosomonas eutropha TaxID=916 RepID=UPI00089256D5|nr:hypothetical protein [Nitrosomonas eutropha]SCX03575.1 hypothetical protein SAMN05216379_102125 [Nitrosomonas eutropha]
MNNIGKGLLIALAITWSSLAFSVQDGEHIAASTPVEETAPTTAESETAVKVDENALPSGIGWQLIRKVEMGNSGKFVNMVLIEKGRQADKTIYSSAIHKLCANEKEFCRIRFWVQKYFIPEKASLTLEQQKSQQADHLFNRAAGIHRTLWACTIDPTSESCIQ